MERRSRDPETSSVAFTLIELLVVIVIIAILAAEVFRVFVFLDENEESINHGALAIMPPGNWSWFNLPASRHKKGCVLSFIDGHELYHKWRGQNVLNYWQPTRVGDPDLLYIQESVPREN